jgi:hypothetical protein
MRLSTVYNGIVSTRRIGTPTHSEVRDDLNRAHDARFLSPLAR